MADLLKAARHGAGGTVHLVEFEYRARGPAETDAPPEPLQA